MNAQHTPGRLRLFDTYADSAIRDDKEKLVAVVLAEKANSARRLVACWNACEGIDTEDLEAGSVSIIAKLHDDAANRLLAQRDELLAALKAITEILDDEIKTATDEELARGLSDPQCLEHVKKELACVIACRAAIEKAEGGAA